MLEKFQAFDGRRISRAATEFEKSARLVHNLEEL